MPQIPLTRLLQQAKRSLGSFFRHHLPWNSGTLFACLVLFILPRSLFHWPYFKNNQLLDAWTKDAFKNVRVWLFCLKKVRGRELQFLRTLVCLPESGPQADQAEVLAKWNCQFPLKKGVGGANTLLIRTFSTCLCDRFATLQFPVGYKWNLSRC